MIPVEVRQGNILEISADAVVVNLFQGVTTPGGATGAVDGAMDGAIRELVESGDFTGKAGEVAVLYTKGAIPAGRVLVAGLGEQEKFDLEAARRAAAAAVHKARDLKVGTLATIVHGAGIGDLPVEHSARATIEASLLALYSYDAPRKEKEERKKVERLVVLEADEGKLQAIEEGQRWAEAIASGVYLTRDLVNLSPNIATPTRLAEVASEIAGQYGMGITIGDRDWARERDMGAYLAVAQGAGEPPKFIVLEHNGDREDLDTIVLVGKGITFDSGGLSLKPSENMFKMKSDMAGAAAVLGAMKAVGMLDIPLRVIGITPATENMPSSRAYRPADVITASNGVTIEVISTDAEGRMILADALVYAGRYNPDAVVDLATLTGACVIALGAGMGAGVFSSDDSLRDKLLSSAESTGERLWPMPLWDEYLDAIKSDAADIKNTGGRMGGVATSAMFLKQFAESYSWAHLDIAGMALGEKERHYTPAGGTGYGVRLLMEFLRNW